MFTNLRKYAVGVLLAIAFCSASLFANVTVSGTLVDSSGAAWAGAAYSITPIQGALPPNLNTGQSVSIVTGTLSAAGAFSGAALGDCTILGGGFRWLITVTAPNGQSFSYLFSVSGATASISTGLSAAAPVLSPGGSKQTIIQVGATFTPTATQTGATILFGALTGAVMKLPVPQLGMAYDFVVTVSNTSNSNEIETDSASTFLLGEVDHSASGIAPLGFWADGTSIQALKMDGAHLGGLIGTRISVKAISATQWEISGVNLGTATMTTAFTATP